jgi:hypothetical protein
MESLAVAQVTCSEGCCAALLQCDSQGKSMTGEVWVEPGRGRQASSSAKPNSLERASRTCNSVEEDWNRMRNARCHTVGQPPPRP